METVYGNQQNFLTFKTELLYTFEILIIVVDFCLSYFKNVNHFQINWFKSLLRFGRFTIHGYSKDQLFLNQKSQQIGLHIHVKVGSAEEPRSAALVPSICWTIFAKRLWRFWAQELENVWLFVQCLKCQTFSDSCA